MNVDGKGGRIMAQMGGGRGEEASRKKSEVISVRVGKWTEGTGSFFEFNNSDGNFQDVFANFIILDIPLP